MLLKYIWNDLFFDLFRGKPNLLNHLHMEGATLPNLELNFVASKTGQMCPLDNIKHNVGLLWMIGNKVNERFISYVF